MKEGRVTTKVTNVSPNGATTSKIVESTFSPSKRSSVHRGASALRFALASLPGLILLLCIARFAFVMLGVPDVYFVSYASQTSGDVSSALYYFDVFGFLRDISRQIGDMGSQFTSIFAISEVPNDGYVFAALNYIIYLLNIVISLGRVLYLGVFTLLYIFLGGTVQTALPEFGDWVHTVMSWNIPYADTGAFFQWASDIVLNGISGILDWLNQILGPLQAALNAITGWWPW